VSWRLAHNRRNRTVRLHKVDAWFVDKVFSFHFVFGQQFVQYLQCRCSYIPLKRHIAATFHQKQHNTVSEPLYRRQRVRLPNHIRKLDKIFTSTWRPSILCRSGVQLEQSAALDTKFGLLADIPTMTKTHFFQLSFAN